MMKNHSMRALLSAAAVSVAALAAPSASRAAPVAMSGDAAAPERAIVQSVYGTFLKSHPEIRLETAQVDLQGKGTASVLARFVSPGTCAASRCETVAVFYDRNAWHTVFQHMAATVTVAPSAGLAGSAGMASLVLDGGERWIWSGYDHYLPDVGSLGNPFGVKDSRPDQGRLAAAAAAAIAADPSTAAMTGRAPLSFRSTLLDVGISGTAYLLIGYAPGACSNELGCPSAVVKDGPNGVTSLWTGLSDGDGAVMNRTTNGVHDIALSDMQGYADLSFADGAFRTTATSYPSSITPAP